MSISSIKLRIAACGVCLLLAAPFALTQTTASLTGSVLDPSGAAVADASVALTSVDTGAQREAKSNESGIYEFTALQPGNYTLAVRKAGFDLTTRQGLRLEVDQTARLDIQLKIGSATETVTVNAAAAVLESATSQIGQVIESREVSDLPLNGRNFAQLAILGPGVVGVGYGSTGTIGSGTRPDDPRPGAELMGNGNREMSNNFMLDGVDDNFRRNGLITLRPTVEDILEFKIQTNLFGAEQGRSSGVTVNVVTRSGTNQFHGTAFEFVRNNAFDARNFFNAKGTQQPKYRQNQFGGSLGGPVIHNRIFFFGDYEGFRKLQGTNTDVNTVPTLAERQGNFSAVRPIYDPASLLPSSGTASGYIRAQFPGNIIPPSRFDSVTSRLIQGYPLPSLPGLANNQFTNPVLEQNYDQGDGRIDWNLNSANTLFGRFSRQDTLTNTPSTFGLRNVPGVSVPLSLGNSTTYAGSAPLIAYNAVIALTHIFSPAFLVDVRMGYSRFNLHNLDTTAPASGEGLGEQLGIANSNQGPKANGVPIFSLSGYTGIGGPASIPTIRYENTFNPVANFTRLVGNHTLRWGANLVRRQITDFQTNEGNGQYTFDSTFTDNPNSPGNTGDAIASFLLGAPGTVTQDFLLVWAGIRALELGAYVSDDWKVTRRLTLNLGLRWEYLPPPVEVANRWANFNNQTGKVLIAGYNSDRTVGVQTEYKLFAPRFGFAYQALQHTVLRGGYGIFYNANGNGGSVYRLHRLQPFGPINSIVVNEFASTYPRIQDGLAPIPSTSFANVANNPTGSFYTVPPNYRNAYAQQFNLGFEQELGWSTILKAYYLGNLGHDLDSQYNFNQAVPGPGAVGPRQPLHTIAPNVVNDTFAATDGNSAYHSLQVTLEKRFSSGVSLLTSYTYSHSIDNVPLVEGGGADGPIPQDPRYRYLDRASSSFDLRQRLTQTVLYQLPFGTGKRFSFSNRWQNAILGNWQVNMILTAQTGLPFTPVLANSVANTGTSSRPSVSGDASLSNPTVAHWFNTSFGSTGAVWFTPAQYTFGDAGRNVLRGPHRTNLDVSLFKEFGLRERLHLQFRSEFFNSLNHPQFDLPSATIGNPTAGTISGTVGTPRDIQLSLRLIL